MHGGLHCTWHNVTFARSCEPSKASRTTPTPPLLLQAMPLAHPGYSPCHAYLAVPLHHQAMQLPPSLGARARKQTMAQKKREDPGNAQSKARWVAHSMTFCYNQGAHKATAWSRDDALLKALPCCKKRTAATTPRLLICTIGKTSVQY